MKTTLMLVTALLMAFIGSGNADGTLSDSQWDHIRGWVSTGPDQGHFDYSQGLEDGFTASVIGDDNATLPDYGIGTQYSQTLTADVGNWTWNVPQHLVLTIDSNVITLKIGSFDLVQYTATTAFEGIAVELEGPHAPNRKIELNDVVITKAGGSQENLGDFQAGGAAATLFTGFYASGNVTRLEADLLPSTGDDGHGPFTITLTGLTPGGTGQIVAVPEPSYGGALTALALVLIVIAFVRQRSKTD